MSNRPLWPGAGFWVLAATVLAFVGLFVWASSESDLDRIRRVLLRWDAGQNVPMTQGEEGALRNLVYEFPAWVDSLANGLSAVLVEETEVGCLRFPLTHLLVPGSDALVPLELRCLTTMAGTEVQLVDKDGEVVKAVCGANGEVVVVELPAAKKARVVLVERKGDTAWAGEQCPIRLVGR